MFKNEYCKKHGELIKGWFFNYGCDQCYKECEDAKWAQLKDEEKIKQFVEKIKLLAVLVGGMSFIDAYQEILIGIKNKKLPGGCGSFATSLMCKDFIKLKDKIRAKVKRLK